MGTPLSMMHNEIRKRVGLKVNTSNSEDRILDEQEQNEVIDDIRHQAVKFDREYQVSIGVIALLSCTLHVIYLFNPLQPPTAVLFPTSDTNPPIPLGTMFAYLHLCLQGYLCISLFHLSTERKIRTLFSTLWSNVQTSTGCIPPIDLQLFLLLISSIAPILCILLRSGWANFVWWSFCGALFLMRLVVQRGRLRDDARIEGLEKLRYHLKGA